MDWLSFLQANRIEYVDSGPNVARGNVNIRCPWCNQADHSHHLGISLNGKGYGCWRNSQHRGTEPTRLIQAILGCSRGEAERWAGKDVVAFGDQDALGRLKVILGVEPLLGPETAKTALPATGALAKAGKPASGPQNSSPLTFPREIRILEPDRVSAGPYWAYLRDRGFPSSVSLTGAYRLHYAIDGPFQGRLIFPVRENGDLLAWTGRAISNKNLIRYKTLSPDPDKADREAGVPIAKASITDCLFNYDALHDGGNALIVCEGPFDAMKLDYYGERFGIRATCLFGKNLHPRQLSLLAEVATAFDKRVLMLDADAWHDGMRILPQLSFLDFRMITCDSGDPGELSQAEIERLAIRFGLL